MKTKQADNEREQVCPAERRASVASGSASGLCCRGCLWERSFLLQDFHWRAQRQSRKVKCSQLICGCSFVIRAD